MEIVDIPARVDVPRDGKGAPLVIPKQGGKPIRLSRTTTFIDCIDDKSSLADWKAYMACYGLAKDSSAAEALMKELEPLEHYSPEWKRAAKRHMQAAVERSGAYDRRETGTDVHALTELVDQGHPLPENLSDELVKDIGAYMMATLPFEHKAVEKFVVCSELGVGGTPDRVLTYTGPGPNGEWFDDEWFIGDLKTGTMEYGQVKMPSQLAIYSRAEVYDHTLFPVEPAVHATTGKPLDDPDGKKALEKWKKIERTPEKAAAAYSPQGPINQQWGIIFNLIPGSGECNLYWADLTIGWKLAQLATVIHAARGSGSRNGLVPFSV